MVFSLLIFCLFSHQNSVLNYNNEFCYWLEAITCQCTTFTYLKVVLLRHTAKAKMIQMKFPLKYFIW